jgi:drug/metabolite transporter (DMT)-like permease
MLVPAALVEAAFRGTPAIGLAGGTRIVYLGALASAGGFLLYSRALRDMDASQVGTFINLVPVVGVATGVVFLGESVTPLALLGGALVLLGVWVSSLPSPSRAEAG